jgi:putative MATE family efflux protein
MQRTVLDDERIGKLLVKLSTPAFFGMFVMTLYNVVDTIFVSRYVGPEGIAGLSIVFPLQMFAMGIGQMTGMGGASQVSILIGAKNVPRAERVLGNAVTITLALSVLIMLAGLLNSTFWLRLAGSSDTILPFARDYFTIILFGYVFQTFAMTIGTLLTAEGNARVSMTGMIIGAVLNIILCAIFIIPLHMGVKGSALATVLAQLVSVIYYARYFLAKKSFLKFHFKNLTLDWDIVKSILSIGVSSLARPMAGSLSAIFVNRMMISYGGDIAISAFGIINRIFMFAGMPGIVIGQGLQPVLGFNIGAMRYDRGLKAIKLAVIAASLISICAFLILYFAPGPIIRIFTSDSELIAVSSSAAKHIFLALYMVGFMMVGSTIFQAIGKAIPSLVTSLARPIVLILLAVNMPRFWQLGGVWYSFPISDFLTALLTLLLLIPEIRRLQKLKKMRDSDSTSIPGNRALEADY